MSKLQKSVQGSSGLPNAAKPVAAVVVKLAVSLLEILISIFPLTFFFVYWETLAAQPVPAVPRSQGSIWQLWTAGNPWSRASLSHGGGPSSCTPRAQWSAAVAAEEDTALHPRNWDRTLAGCCLDRPEDPPWLRVFLFYPVCWHLWSHSLGTECILLCCFFPAKLYVKYISTGVGSGEQSMYMHMSDMFSYYFWQYVFSAWNNKFCIARSLLLPLQLLSFSVHRFFDFKAGKQPYIL